MVTAIRTTTIQDGENVERGGLPGRLDSPDSESGSEFDLGGRLLIPETPFGEIDFIVKRRADQSAHQ